VISVGNLTWGGSGKTPFVVELARMLLARGERPAILTRGYGRRDKTEGVLVVSDGARILEPVTRSGDEPQLLARQLPGVPVLVSPDRYLAGSLAARHFGTTVSLLDDGFQHVQLERDIDLLLVSSADLEDRVLPSGRLREPLEAARFADALLVSSADDEVMAIARELGHAGAFHVAPRYGSLRDVGRVLSDPPQDTSDPPHVATVPSRVLAVAGIARPARFFVALRALGYDVVREMAFRDHHWFSRRDLDEIRKAARAVGASMVVTTEKDAVRLQAEDVRAALADGTGEAVRFVYLPMTIEVSPANVFESWLLHRLARSRGSSSPAGEVVGSSPAL